VADYTNFTQVLRDRKGTTEKRRPFVENWLQKTYDIDYDLNAEYFAELTRPHDHDNQPLHWGNLPYETGYGWVTAELVKDAKDQWRIAVAFDPQGKERTVLQPEAEASDANRDARLRFLTIISAGPEPESEGQVLMMPAQMAQGLNFKPGNGGRFSDISVLYSTAREEETRIGGADPANLPTYLTRADREPEGLPVDVSRYLEPTA
jgi:hypothetical protein